MLQMFLYACGPELTQTSSTRKYPSMEFDDEVPFHGIL